MWGGEAMSTYEYLFTIHAICMTMVTVAIIMFYK